MGLDPLTLDEAHRLARVFGIPSLLQAKTGNYTAKVGELVQCDVSGGGFTVTLPTDPAPGALVAVKKVDASLNTLTIAPAGGGSIEGQATATTITQWAGAIFTHVGSNVWLIAASMATTGPAGTDGADGVDGVDGILSTIQDEGVSLTQRSTLDFVGAGVTAADSGGKTVVTIPGGSGGGGGITLTREGGYYHTLPGSTSNNKAMDDGSMYALPIVFSKAVTLDRIGLKITSGLASAVVRLGIYNDDGGMRPGSKLLDAGTIDASSTGDKTITISQAVSAGVYWLVANRQGGSGGLLCQYTQNCPLMIPPTAIGGVSGANNSGFNTNGGFTGALPSTYTPVYDEAQVPRVFVRVA